MKNKIEEVINAVLNSRLFIVLIGIILFIKTIFFYKSTIASIEELQVKTILGTISFLVVLICFISVLPNKVRIRTILIIDFLISILLYADNLYYTFSSSVLSVAQISNLQYTEQIIDTLPSLIELKQILYFIDLIIIAICYISKILKTKQNHKYSRKQKLENLIIAIIGIITFCLIGYSYVENGTQYSWNKDLQIAESTIYGYHISDIIKSFNNKKQTKYKTYDEMINDYNELKEEYKENFGEEQYNFKKTLENKNIIILQLESIQEFVRNKTINGKEITPNLNKFLNENIEFTNMHMQSYSTTADSEYSTITSTYPMENGMSFSKYYTNTYNNLFKMFNDANYHTSFIHGNYSTFWNRGNVYKKFEVNDLIFKDSFEDLSENINGDLSDELLYKQAVQKLKNNDTPFISFLVSASSHTPFTLDGIRNKEQKVNIDVGKYKGTYFGDYLEAVNYADYAFGILIDELKKEGLYDDLSILIFGDHNGLNMYNDEMIEFLEEQGQDLTDVDIKLNYTRVLCGMKIPGAQNIKIDKMINKLDIKPTLAYLCNLEDGFSLGTNMFENKDFVCLNNERIISKEYYYDENWYDIKTGEEINLDNISNEEKQKLENYYNYMKRELDISLSVNINNLLK